MKRLKKLANPAFVLFFLAPAIGELLSGSAPPIEFFNPFSLLLLGILYGGGAIIIRELTFRWKKGWASIIILGAAYGIVEEGLMVKSFFDPHWMDLGLLGQYGRWAGVNWIWSLELTIYHAVFSIAIPILIVSLIFPQQRTQPWVSPRSFRWLSVLFGLDILFGHLVLTTYRPPLLGILLAAGLVWALYRLAHRISDPSEKDRGGQPARARWFGFTGFFGTLLLFFISWVLPEINTPVLITLVVLASLPVIVGWALRRHTRGWGAVSDLHLWALVSGALSFFILLAPLQEMDVTRPDNTIGMTWVALLTATLLYVLFRRVKATKSKKDEDQLAIPAQAQ